MSRSNRLRRPWKAAALGLLALGVSPSGEAFSAPPATTAEGEPLPARVESLWEQGRKEPASEAGVRATIEALRLLVADRRSDDAVLLARSLGRDEDAAWEALLSELLREARSSRSYESLEQGIELRVQALGESADNAAVEEKARLWFTLGRVHLEESRRDDAYRAFERVVDAAPGSRLAEAAAAMLDDLEVFAPGRMAPPFSAVTLAGEPLTLSQLRGEAVLVAVWASW